MDPEKTTIVLTAVLAALTSSGFMSLVVYLIQRHDKKAEKEHENDSAITRMLLGLGHDKILYLTDRYVRRGVITLKEKRNLDFLYTPYVELGGNGDCKIGYDACEQLRVVSEEEAESIDQTIRRKEIGFEV